MKPNCHNRPPFRDTVLVQDGWIERTLKEIISGDEVSVRIPITKTIPDPMSKGCQQHGQMGEATLHPEKWDCSGCKWKPNRG